MSPTRVTRYGPGSNDSPLDGVLVTMVAGRIRMLTHGGVAPVDIDAALDAWRKVAAELAGSASAGSSW